VVNAKFAGVYFTSDPRKEGGWILEVISGLGEELVSGHVTPGHVEESGVCHHLPNGFESAAINEIVKTGAEVAKSLGFPVDMEWAIDINGKLFVLQARPITTHKNKSSEEIISFEMDRLIRQNLLSTTWDGQTFSEWNGLPSPFTFSLWQEAFSPQHAFGMSLQSLGYLSFK
jgi:phosphoenolpyruvate synthase/pyruvate phosphate dikinase